MANKFTKDNLRNAFSLAFSDEQIYNINRMYNHLKNTLNWSDRNIAAVMGNIMLESAYKYGLVSSAGATGAFLFLGDRLKDYTKWRAENGYADGGLSLASYLDHVIRDLVDPRMDSVIKARKLLLNKNHVDSINANLVLSWALPAIDNKTFYPVSDLKKAWDDPNVSLDDMTLLWVNTIEKPGASEAKKEDRINYANKFYKLITHKEGGIINFIGEFKKGGKPKIHIKEKNKGKFTDYCGGKVTEECIERGKNSSSPTIRKRATFAANARKWKHENGGVILAKYGLSTDKVYYESEEVDNSTTPFDLKLKERVDNWDRTRDSDNEESTVDTNPIWDTFFRDLDNSPDSERSERSSSTSEEVKLRMSTAMLYLMNKGFSKEAAAGIVGVFTAESLLVPGVLNLSESLKYGSSAGKGIGLWSNSRRKQYDNYMKGKSGLEAELDFFLEDLKSRPLVMAALQSATSVDEATKAMHLGYENGSSGAFATPEELTTTYSRAWSKLPGYGSYNYNNEHNRRVRYATTAASLMS